MLSALLLFGAQARADDGACGGGGEGDSMLTQGRLRWTSSADSRPVSPWLGIQTEVGVAAPLSRSSIDSSTGRSEGFAAFAYFSDEVDLVRRSGAYHGPAPARSTNPGTKPCTDEVGTPAGRHGPRARAETLSSTQARSEAINGASHPGAGSVNHGRGTTSVVLGGDRVIRSEAVSQVHGVEVGKVRIGEFLSDIEMRLALGGGADITYHVTLAGVEVGGEQLVGWGHEAIVLMGNRLRTGGVVDQFNDQVREHGRALQGMGVAASVVLLEPTVRREADGGVTVTAPVLEVSDHNKLAAPGLEHRAGLRLGAASLHSLLAGVEASAPGSGDSAAPAPIPLLPAPPAVSPAAVAGPFVVDPPAGNTAGLNRSERASGAGTVPGAGRPTRTAETEATQGALGAGDGSWRATVPAPVPVPGGSLSASPIGMSHRGFVMGAAVLMAVVSWRGAAVARKAAHREPSPTRRSMAIR